MSRICSSRVPTCFLVRVLIFLFQVQSVVFVVVRDAGGRCGIVRIIAGREQIEQIERLVAVQLFAVLDAALVREIPADALLGRRVSGDQWTVQGDVLHFRPQIARTVYDAVEMVRFTSRRVCRAVREREREREEWLLWLDCLGRFSHSFDYRS